MPPRAVDSATLVRRFSLQPEHCDAKVRFDPRRPAGISYHGERPCAAAEDIKFEPLPPIDRPPPSPSAELSLQPPSFLDQPSRLPSTEQPPAAPASQEAIPAGETPIGDELPPKGKPINLDGSAEAKPAASLGDFMGYRYSTDASSGFRAAAISSVCFRFCWVVTSSRASRTASWRGLAFTSSLAPCRATCPLAYDFSIGYQIRQRIGPLAFDLASAIQISSDFNGDAHKGVQLPGHGVGFLTVRPELDLVFGVDYLDRADIKLLPVAGVIWKPNLDMRFELVFPRPRAVFQLTDTYRFYVSGELGGGSWAINRPTLGDNVATYRDLRVCVGFESVDKDGRQAAIEVGYLFDRRLEYTSCIGNMQLDDAVMLRLLTMY